MTRNPAAQQTPAARRALTDQTAIDPLKEEET
jgi:hypothetical protein